RTAQHVHLRTLDIDLEEIDGAIGADQGIEATAFHRNGLAHREVALVHRQPAVLDHRSAVHAARDGRAGLAHHRRGADAGGDVERALLFGVPQRAIVERLLTEARHLRALNDRLRAALAQHAVLVLVRLETDQLGAPR